ncbi:RNI-like protein [Cryphonectria parasitica EP155]|uniref:RNI-like protein n=1 Tax=Cryphonectria parasitica (strain ATCC 38755 / EP155) TaxID=660469 RepID=A0A9P4XUS6_CRYP1|nr:RNI-like protein [Cryphonectria parasitica EP155]KAF3761383.1 RNI-like protein [Cryphonectria parasitica EP155]
MSFPTQEMDAQACAALLKATQETNYQNPPPTVFALPKRRPHAQRPKAQQTATLLFPNASPEKAIIRYEEQRKRAVAARRAAEAAAKTEEEERWRLLLERARPDMGRGAWDPVLDPVELPRARPMPVQVGDTADFADCFAFLKGGDDDDDDDDDDDVNKGCEGRVEALLNHTPTTSSPLSKGITIGKEPGHATRLLEFKRGVIYEDGRLDLCKMVVGPDHIDALMDALESNTHIRHFLLGNNVITNHGARRIAQFARDHPHRMQTWYLAGNHIKPAGFHALASALRGSDVLGSLWLKRNPLGPACVADLLALLASAPRLRVLDLETCELGDAGIAALFDGLARTLADSSSTSTSSSTNSLEAIYINANGASTAAAEAIATFLASPACRLRYLMMSNNPLGDAGAQALAAGIRDNTTLEVLTLASCGFSSHGVSAVCTALARHPRIRHLDLASRFSTADLGQRFNHVTDDAIAALASLVTTSSSLRFLHLGYVLFSPDGLEQLRDAVVSPSSSLVGFEASRVVGSGEGEEGLGRSGGGGGTCSLRVRRALEANYLRFYAGQGQMAEGVPYAVFIGMNGVSRLLRNHPDVRLIDSVYRTRDKGKLAAGKARKFWDLELNEDDKLLWARLDEIE